MRQFVDLECLKRLKDEFGINVRVDSKRGTIEPVTDMDLLKLAATRPQLEKRVNENRCRRIALEELKADVDSGKVNADDWTDSQIHQELETRMKKIDQKSEQHIPQPLDGRMSEDEYTTNIATTFLKKTNEGLSKQEELVERVADAKKALELAVSTFRRDYIDYLDELDGYLLRLRQTRMALDTESRHILTQLKDIRQFFLSEQHVEEVKRLQDFAVTMGQLKAFKESGFLDAITDTILKLEVKP